MPTSLVYRSKQYFEALQNIPRATDYHAQALGLQGLITGEPVLNAIMAAAVDAVQQERSLAPFNALDAIPGVKEQIVDRSSREPMASILSEAQRQRIMEDLKANGCGAANGFKFFDSPASVDFKPACDAHDRNYATLGFPKEEADRIFLADMRKACERTNESRKGLVASILNSACLAAAEAYYWGVSYHGKDAYNSAQALARQLIELEP